ncbi:MAG: membrane protein insertase YidC [Kiritimatiellae bacterium]|nr:membrane protein insertase YidC [Kiritimatiellia bacterium]
MKKKDWIPVAILFILLLAYPQIDKAVVSKFFPPKEAPVPAAAPAQTDIPAQTDLVAAETDLVAPDAPPPPAPTPEQPLPEPAVEEHLNSVPDHVKAPEERHVLANDRLELTLSSHGAGVVHAALIAQRHDALRYPAEAGSDTPVSFDFSDRPAAAPVGYPGLRARDDFEVTDTDAKSITYRKALPNGLVLSRTLTLGETYQLRIHETIQNTSAAPIALRQYGLQAGFMDNLPGERKERTPLLGIDTLTGSESVKYWAKKFSKWFPLKDRSVQAQRIPGPGKAVIPVDWVAVKNKYFAQILTPENGADSCTALAAYGEPVQSSFMFLFPRTDHPIDRVSATLTLPDYVLAEGQILTQNATLYIGPKVYEELKANGPHQEDVLQLGFWRPIGILILKIMVWIQAHIWPYSYGLAIIMLTFFIRIVFWPLNHKSMVSTRRMQEVQPLIAALKEKHKSDPQKQQQEMMALYKEHKINPMGGCLPMLIQIPVFFALFVVLRGAIELRFSSFLWIGDLSTPENLFKDVLPIAINILPIFMGLTMWIQQKLTPTSDPQQQKMMMMMPVIFTVMFYSFPSGLSLYWSTNQVLMIVQLLWMKKRHPTPAPASR